MVDLRPNHAAGAALDDPVVRARKASGGTHGYAPTHPERLAAFFIAGPGIKARLNLGEIDMRAIAPTLPRRMGRPRPTADLQPLEVQAAGAPR